MAEVAAHHPPRLRLPAWGAPAVAGGGALAVCLATAVVDPNEPGRYPLCPFRAVTGLDCPGCGTLRALHALSRGNVGLAADLNVLTVLFLPVLVWAWAGWLRQRLGSGGGGAADRVGRESGGRRPAVPTLSPRAAWVVAVAVPVFWVLRNLPVAPLTWLAS